MVLSFDDFHDLEPQLSAEDTAVLYEIEDVIDEALLGRASAGQRPPRTSSEAIDVDLSAFLLDDVIRCALERRYGEGGWIAKVREYTEGDREGRHFIRLQGQHSRD